MDNSESIPLCQDVDFSLFQGIQEARPPGRAREAAGSTAPAADLQIKVGEGAALPCLYSNNSIQDSSLTHRLQCIRALCGVLSPYHKRQAHALYHNVGRLIEQAPSLGHVGFFTLTTKDSPDSKEFSRRWNSMLTNYWSQSPYFGRWIGVFEQQLRGAWHLHILVVLTEDIRTGINWEEFGHQRYKSASPYLRSLWRELRGACIRYGFGRHELLPIRSNAEGMARYLGKYISKHIGQRDEASKGKRLITGSRDWPRSNSRFAWNTEGAKEWRRKVSIFAAALGVQRIEMLYYKLGPNWAWKHLDTICNIDEFAAGLQQGVYAMKNESLVDVRSGEILF